MALDRRDLVAQLFELSKIYVHLGDEYRAKAFETGALVVDNYPGELPQGEKLRKLPGIGRSNAECIEEWFKTGRISRIDKLRGLPQPTVKPGLKLVIHGKYDILKLFQGLHGVGPKTAENWYKRGWRSMEDVERNLDKLNNTQRLSFQSKFNSKERIPRSEIQVLEERLKEILDDIKWEICGSYRRLAPDSGDVDILLMAEGHDSSKIIHRRSHQESLRTPRISLNGIVKRLTDAGIITGNYTPNASKKFMGLMKISEKERRLDLRWVEEKHWPFALLHFTGSGALNVKMRNEAIARGWKLCEYNLLNEKGKEIPCQSEKDIFEALGMTYLSPEERSI